MGTCTSTGRHRRKQHRLLHKKSIVLDNKQISSLPLTLFPNQQPHVLLSNFDTQSIFSKTDTNSLIQFYPQDNNSSINNWMSSSTPTRIPVPKSRLPIYQAQSSAAGSKNIIPLVTKTIQTGFTQPMSTPNRAPVPSSPQNITQPRFGFIPRPIAPVPSFVARSRSISPSSTISANSSSSTVSQRLTKTSTIPKPLVNRPVTPSNTRKSKLTPSFHQTNKDSSTATNRLHSNTPLQASSTVSPLTTTPSTKTDVNTIRDRYKTQTRMNFFTRRSPLSSSMKSPSIDSPVIPEEKTEQLSNDEQIPNVRSDKQNDDLKTESSQHADSAYVSNASSSNRPPSVHDSQANRHRQRTASTLSSSSFLSDALNQDIILDDDNCSLKSDDLICDYDDTLTLDSVSKTDRTDSCSSISLKSETNKKPTMITPVATTKPNFPPFQSIPREHRSATIAKCSTTEKSNNNLQESLDELTQLSHRIDSIVDNEHHRRLLTRSLSLKPPPTSLPPREDAEQITMDIESYRQVMKDVMVVKTILHQLDRLLKHSDGANMTDSMIGSFHDAMITSRRVSSSGVDENFSYDDLIKEVMVLRKDREQDKQTIKLLQEQMYKYSSQTNG